MPISHMAVSGYGTTEVPPCVLPIRGGSSTDTVELKHLQLSVVGKLCVRSNRDKLVLQR